MSSFNENRQLLTNILRGRQPAIIQEIEAPSIWVEDLKVGSSAEVTVSLEAKLNWLQVRNETGESPFGLVPIDGSNGVFKKSNPVVKDQSPFQFEWTYFVDPITKERKQRTETAGKCDCLILNKKWHFLEFKTAKGADLPPTSDPKQADQNRIKGSLQLARTLTFFREQALEKNIPFQAACECVLVTRPGFPIPVVSQDATSFDAVKFFILYKAKFIEVNTDEIYSLT